LLPRKVDEKKYVWLPKRSRKTRKTVLVLGEWKHGGRKRKLHV
jgi:hypothetical protein